MPGKKKNIEQAEALTRLRPDRRILYNVPDNEKIRSGQDRRGSTLGERAQSRQEQSSDWQKKLGLRYLADFDVSLTIEKDGKRQELGGRAVDISATGILIAFDKVPAGIEEQDSYIMQFDLPPGTMGEGYESRVKVPARFVRFAGSTEGESRKIGFEFLNPLNTYFQKKRWGYSVSMASLFLFVAVLIIVLMRVESVLYFKYNIYLYLYSLIAASFLLTRYLFGALYRNVPINPDFTPGVSVIIPCFNEEEWIDRTILSCINQDYPLDKLEVIVVDDCSNDNSLKRIYETQEMLMKEAERFKIAERLRVLPMEKNGGKREALARGVVIAKHSLVVFVDSDSFLDGKAIRNLVQPFQDPKMGGVTGRTDVENTYTNALTKLQSVRYYVAFRIMKAAESYFDSVTCLSGPLSCYRKDLVLRFKDAWLNQKFLGQPATFGDDRSLTNFMIKNYRTTYQDSAICSTIVPSKGKSFLKQQMRWKRSWLRESLRAGKFIWRKEPCMSLFFYIGFVVPIAAPAVFAYNLIYVPIAHSVFPSTFLMGLLLMALLLSFSYLIFRKSKVWVYGFLFCLFYEVVLLWQMPVAWFTFAKSTWGTRETPQDIEAKLKKQGKGKTKVPRPAPVPVVIAPSSDALTRNRRSHSDQMQSSNAGRHAGQQQQYGTRQQRFKGKRKGR